MNKILGMILAILLLFLFVQLNKQKEEKREAGKQLPTVSLCSNLYINSINGYEACSPTGWHYREFGGGKEIVGFDERPIPTATEYLGRFVIQVSEKTLEEEKLVLVSGLTRVKEEEIVIDGVLGVKIEGIISSAWSFFNGQRKMMVLVKGPAPDGAGLRKTEKKIYEIVFTNTAENFIGQLPVFLDFLESFKFKAELPSVVKSVSGNLILEMPLEGAIITSPVVVKGKYKGEEKTVRIELVGTEGRILGNGMVGVNEGDKSPSSGTGLLYLTTANQGGYGPTSPYGLRWVKGYEGNIYFEVGVPPERAVLRVEAGEEKVEVNVGIR